MSRFWQRLTARTSTRGQALIELLVAFGIFALFSAGVTTLSVDALWTLQTGPEYTGASAYAQEGLEAARQIADRSWTLMALGNHGVTIETAGNETRYTFTGISDTRGIYTRVVSIAEVQRDGSGAIVESGGTPDPDSRRVTATVSWQTGFTRRQQQVVTNTLLTNWEGFSWTETKKAEFEQGVLTDTEAIAKAPPPTDNGSVRIRGNVGGSSQFKVKGAVSFNSGGPSDGRDLAISGSYVYLVTARGGGNARFYVVDASDTSAPQLVSELNPSGKLFSIALSGNYAYVATDRNNGELRVVNITNPQSPSLGAELDVESNEDGLSIAIEGTYLYLGTNGNPSPGENPEFYIFSLANPAVPTLVGSLEIPGSPHVQGIAPVGSRVYLATSNGSGEIQTVDVSNPASPQLVATGTEDLANCDRATNVSISSTKAYVTCSGTQGLYVLSLASVDNPSVLGSLALGGVANDVAVSGSFAYLATEISGSQFERVAIADPARLVVNGTTALDGPGRAIAISGTCAYVTTNGNEQELAIICGAGGGDTLSEAGSFDTPGTEDGRSLALQGTTAFLGTGDALYAVDISLPENPTLLGSLATGGSVEDIALDGSNAYLATTRSDAELLVVSIANPSSLTVLGSYNTPDPGQSVAVSGSHLYFGTAGSGQFLILDISAPSAPSLRGQIATGRHVTDIVMDNNDADGVFVSLQSANFTPPAYATACQSVPPGPPPPPPPPPPGPPPLGGAPPTNTQRFAIGTRYISAFLDAMKRVWVRPPVAQAFSHAPSADDTKEVHRIDVSNPAAPVLGASANPHEVDSGRGISSLGSSVYLVTGDKTDTEPEFYILQYTSGTLALESSGSALNVGGTANDVAPYDPFAFLATAVSGKEFTVVDISNHASPILRGWLDLCAEANALAISGTNAYVATAHDSKELTIVKGIDAITFVLTGTAESIRFDATQPRSWEQIGWSQTLNGGTITFQVRWATPSPQYPTCTAALGAVQYVGPNDNPANPSNPSGSYTTSDSAVTNEAGQSPSAQCFQWRATLDGTGATSPEMHDVTVTFK